MFYEYSPSNKSKTKLKIYVVSGEVLVPDAEKSFLRALLNSVAYTELVDLGCHCILILCTGQVQYGNTRRDQGQ